MIKEQQPEHLLPKRLITFFSKIFFSENFELFYELVIPNNRYYNSFTYPERPPYLELCQKYSKTEIDYIIHQYLP